MGCGVGGVHHKRGPDGYPLCGQDQIGFMFDSWNDVSCRACHLSRNYASLSELCDKLADQLDVCSLTLRDDGYRTTEADIVLSKYEQFKAKEEKGEGQGSVT